MLVWAALLGAVAGGVQYLEHRGAAAERAQHEADKAAAQEQRRKDIAEYVVSSSEREVKLAAQLHATETKLAIEILNREANGHVSKAADSRCTVPAGFVYDHDAALRAVSRDAAIPAQPADVDRASGLSLSLVRSVLNANYGECGKLLDRYNAGEERRYTACIEWDRKWGTKSNCTRGGAGAAPGNPETKAR